MSMICLMLRPNGDGREKYRVVSSVSGSVNFKDRTLAWFAIEQLATRYPSIFVLEFDHADDMQRAFAIKNGRCRDLRMIVSRESKKGYANYCKTGRIE